jgi:ribonucleoside-diphosphate reductase alpha chain
MQSVFQKYTDNAVSKTINLSENTTIEQIAKLIIEGYDYKLKGFTVYRDKSRDQQVLSTK